MRGGEKMTEIMTPRRFVSSVLAAALVLTIAMSCEGGARPEDFWRSQALTTQR
ncbi:MAG TPA: hypothetical protein VFS14_00460 [Candidatus Saccharimonadales bacterium]|nr:hypothetical protein [Candidatus Saccharimonadales bacterium]